MLCPNCQSEFNADSNLPRILVFCGHTFCHNCIQIMLTQEDTGKWTLTCPECKTVNQVADGVNSFPKNLVLLQVNGSQQQLQKTASIEKETQKQSSNCKITCQEHNKKLEAFCEKDLQVLCIDCILSEQHKSHEIISVQKAAEKQKLLLFDEVNTAQQCEEKLKFIYSDIKRHINDMQTQAEKNRRELSQIYNYLRELILEREQALKRQISENLTREEEEFQIKLDEIQDFISQISSLKGELVQQSQEQELELLSKAKQRLILSQDVNGIRAKDLISFSIQHVAINCQSLVEIKREQELTQISKIVHPSYKGNPSTQGAAGSTLYSHTLSTANKLKRGTTLTSQHQQISIMPQCTIETKTYKEDPLLRKSTKNGQIKTKQSPHRQQIVKKQEAKKQGVVVLDQNKKSKPTKIIGNSVQQNINLYNYNNIHQQSYNNDAQDDVVGPDDVSSICPLDTNECYYNYSPRNGNRVMTTDQKPNESSNNLNELLDCLNKSGDQEQLPESSTTSETNGSNSEGNLKEINLKQVKSTIETPKTKINQWGNQIANIKECQLNKDNSISEFEEYKNQQSKIQSPLNLFKEQIESQNNEQNLQKSASLKKFQSNINKQQFENSNEQNDLSREHIRRKSRGNQHQLQSLSQERNKRKVNRMEIQSKENSPAKEQEGKDNDIMIMLQECSKNIEKLELKPLKKTSQNSMTQSPNKPIANICLVDLTQKEDTEENEELLLQVIQDVDEQQESDFNEQDKGIPKQYDSPLKRNNSDNVEDFHELEELKRDEMLKPKEECDSPNRNYCELNTNSRAYLQQQQQQLQCSMSVDMSVSDPFRALMRMKEEFIFVFSGFNDTKLMTCEAFDVQRGAWKEVCQIEKPRTKFSAVPISKSRILIFGGKQTDGQRTGEIEEYNLKTNKFKLLPFKMPKPRSGFAACVKRDEGKIFFCGGNSGSVLRKFDCLDLKKGKWSRLPEMIQKRDELAVALGPDGKVYAIGGYGGGGNSQQNMSCQQDQTLENSKQTPQSNCLRTAERFNFETNQWEMLPEMNEARRALAAVALPDGIYAIGGYDGKQYLSSVEKFDLQKQEWVPVKSMNTSRCTLAAVASSDCQYIYALGGFNGNSLDLVERYNIMSDEWEFTTPMISKRFMHEAVNLVTH